MAFFYSAAFKNKWLGQPATAQGVVPASAGLVTPFGVGQPVQLYYWRAQNRGAATAALAVVALMKDAAWKCLAWVDATTTATDQTAAAQSAATNDVTLETGAVNDGFLVSAPERFGAVSVDVTTAGAGNTPAATHIIEYWNGTAWTQIPAIGLLSDIPRAVDWALGEALVLFNPPADWAIGGSGTNVPAANYNLRVRRNALPTIGLVNALARRLYVGMLFGADDLVAINGYSERFAETVPIDIPSSCGAVGLACSAADDGNTLELILA